MLRKEALARYRDIQAGMRAKSDLLHQYRNRKNLDIKSFDTLKQERKDMIEYLKNMKYLLNYKETSREEEMRWILLREREHNCAKGNLESCQFFHPTYINDQEMVAHGLPSHAYDADDDKKQSTKPKRKRFVYEYTNQELESFKRSNGLQRIRATLCPVQDLLPDDSSRIFVRLDEYYDYMLNHGLKQQRTASTERSERRMPARQMRKHNTLFGRYLEDGEWGYITAAITLSEWVGLLCSPLSLVHRAVSYWIEMGGLYTWDLIESCDRELENWLSKQGEDNVEVDGLLMIYLRNVLRWIKSVCEVILDAEVDGSATSRFLSAIDYTQNSVIMTYLDAFYERTKTLFWAWDIAYNAPILYYEYYVLHKYQQLPPKRNACLLREAIQLCETELDRLHTQLAEESEAQSLKAKSMEESLAFKRKSANKRSSSAEQRVTMDFGVDSAWEALAHNCVSSSAFGEYNYTFCLFDEIKQDEHVSLGLFRHWGLGSTSSDSSQQLTLDNMPLLRQYLHRLQYQAQRQNTLSTSTTLISSSALLDMQDLVHSLTVELPVSTTEYLLRRLNVSAAWLDDQKAALSSSNISVVQATGQWLTQNIVSSVHLSESERQALIAEQLKLYYQHQFYDLGTPCPVKPSLRRSTQVTFKCGNEFRIAQVSELSVNEFISVHCPLIRTFPIIYVVLFFFLHLGMCV